MDGIKVLLITVGGLLTLGYGLYLLYQVASFFRIKVGTFHKETQWWYY